MPKSIANIVYYIDGPQFNGQWMAFDKVIIMSKYSRSQWPARLSKNNIKEYGGRNEEPIAGAGELLYLDKYYISFVGVHSVPIIITLCLCS